MELVVVIAIVAIVLTLAVPGLARLISRSRMTTAVNTLVTNLQLARSEAVKRDSRVTLCPVVPRSSPSSCAGSTSWQTGYIVFSNSTGQVIRHVQGSANAPISITTSAGRTTITYQPDGTRGGANATFTFCDASGRVPPQAVIVSNPGRPRISSNDSSLSCP